MDYFSICHCAGKRKGDHPLPRTRAGQLVSKTPHTLFRGIRSAYPIFITRSKRYTKDWKVVVYIISSSLGVWAAHKVKSRPNLVTFPISFTETRIVERSIELAVSNFVRIRRDRLAVQCFKPCSIWQSRSWVTACFEQMVQLQYLLIFHGQTFEDRNFKLCHDLWYDVRHTWPTFSKKKFIINT